MIQLKDNLFFIVLLLLSSCCNLPIEDHLAPPVGLQRKISLVDCSFGQMNEEAFLTSLELIFEQNPKIVVFDSVSNELFSILKKTDVQDRLIGKKKSIF